MANVMKIGIVGLGQIAENAYLPDLHNPSEGFEVTWLCDSADHRLKWGQSVVPTARTTTRYADMLRDRDLNWVFVLTPLMAHASMVRQALMAGKNVYTEKPLSVDFDEAREIVDLARKKRLLVASAPVMLLYPVYEHVRSLVLGGAIGTVTSARVLMANPGPNTWQFKSDPGWFFREKTASKIPPIPDLAVYGISFLTRVFGPAKRVSAMASLVQRERRIDKVSAPGFKPYTIRPRIDDSVVVSIEYANGVLATIASNYTTGGRRPDEYEFYGTEGTLTMPLAADRFSIQSTLPPYDKPAELHDVSMAGRRGGVFYEEWQWGPILVRHIRDCLARGVKPLVGASFTLHVVEVIAAAMRSARTGSAEKITTSFQHDRKLEM